MHDGGCFGGYFFNVRAVILGKKAILVAISRIWTICVIVRPLISVMFRSFGTPSERFPR